MNRKWQPSKAQRREFAQRMANDPEFREAYLRRKEEREQKRRANSRFNYASAGGYYVPTKIQHDAAFDLLRSNPTPEQREAAEMVQHGWSTGRTVHHDYIHIVNEFIRKTFI